MKRLGWTLAFVACILGTLGFGAAGRPGQPETGSRSRRGSLVADSARDSLTTMSGIYSDAQARRGKDTFAGSCLSCHQPSSQTGDEFDQHWKDHPLNDLFQYISQQMPQDNPGSLDANTVTDVIAYVLQLNAMPAGAADLAPDTAAMMSIRITRTRGSTR